MFPTISYFPLLANPQEKAVYACRLFYFLTSIPFLPLP